LVLTSNIFNYDLTGNNSLVIKVLDVLNGVSANEAQEALKKLFEEEGI